MKRLGLLYLAAQNLRRKPFRSFVTIAIVGLAAGTLFSATLLIGSVDRSLEVGMERLGADLLVVPEGYQESGQAALITGAPTSFYMSRSVLDQVRATPGVDQASPQLFIESLLSVPCCTGRAQLVGYDPDTDFVITPWLNDNLNRSLEKDEVVIGSLILANKGEQVHFYGQAFNVAGVLDATGMGADESVFMKIDDAYQMAADSSIQAVEPIDVKPGQISSVLVKMAPGTNIDQLSQRIKTNVPGTMIITANELSRSVTDRLSGFTRGFIAIDAIVWVMSLLTIAAIFSMIVNERQREIGLLRAMGASRKFVFRLMLTEAVFLTAAGGLVGIFIGGAGLFIFKAVITTSLGIPYLWPPLLTFVKLTLITLLLAIATGAAASLYPAYSSSRLEPYAAIRQGE
ncbi:MAG: FtsX-like permease family protein [Thermoleophilia bacterium]|jgi:putative ABC transport system permease protein